MLPLVAVASTAMLLFAAGARAEPDGSGSGSPGFSAGSDGVSYRAPAQDFTFTLGGRLHLDYGGGHIAPGFEDALDTELLPRRLWVEPQASIGPVVFALQYDIPDDTLPIKDAVVAWRPSSRLVLTLGNFTEPISLENLMSTNNIPLMERSLINALAPARSTGAAIGIRGERWTLVGGVFGGNINREVFDAGMSGGARVTFAPIQNERRTLHLGVAGNIRDLAEGRALVFSTTGESGIFDGALVETPELDAARSLERLGLEAVYLQGAFSLQAEYITARARRDGSDAIFQGGYALVSWVLSGKNRSYQLTPDWGSGFGILGGVGLDDNQRFLQGGAGAVELVARLSALDLSDAGVEGGTERNLAFGLNWYPEENVRLMFNYIRANAEDVPAVGGRSVNADIYQSRLQIAF